jgi:hypothetical protein
MLVERMWCLRMEVCLDLGHWIGEFVEHSLESSQGGWREFLALKELWQTDVQDQESVLSGYICFDEGDKGDCVCNVIQGRIDPSSPAMSMAVRIATADQLSLERC